MPSRSGVSAARSRRVRGSANGARVIGAVGGLVLAGLCMGLPFERDLVVLRGVVQAIVTGGLLIRPWFMGVWIADSEVIIRSWWRTYRVGLASIVEVSTVEYGGILSTSRIGYIPGLGRICVLALRCEGDELARDYSGTVGRAKTVTSVGAAIRARQHPAASRARPRTSDDAKGI